MGISKFSKIMIRIRIRVTADHEQNRVSEFVRRSIPTWPTSLAPNIWDLQV
jgi:hypothetical protein